MNASATVTGNQRLRELLRGELNFLRGWIAEWQLGRLAFCVSVIACGAGLYGAAMGWWRAPLQGLYVALKFPLILLLTALGNALLNAILAPLLGLNLGFRQSFLAILTSFTIAAAILGAFSPLIAFMLWNAPPLASDPGHTAGNYAVIKLTHVAAITFAGTVANVRLLQLLKGFSANVHAARRVLVAWLAGNLFLGSQLCWILRPFIGSPDLPVEFLRRTALRGNFYEDVFRSIARLLTS
jgi:hypothetical protein